MCTNDSSTCTACAGGYFEWLNPVTSKLECISSCPISYYLDLTPPGTCKSCHVFNANCKNLSIEHLFLTDLGDVCDATVDVEYCDTCEPGMFRGVTSGECYVTCPEGTYEEGTDCKDCGTPNCLDCIFLSKIRGVRCEICQGDLIRNPDQTACITIDDCDDNYVGHRVSGRLPSAPLERYDLLQYKACDKCLVPNCKYFYSRLVPDQI